MKLSKSRCISLFLIIVMLLSFMQVQATEESIMEDPGLIMPTEAELATYPQAPLMSAPTALPAVVDLSPNMPTPGRQGTGACTAWATVYAYKSYQEKMEKGWNINDPAHLFSPAYVFNQLAGDTGGITIADAMNLMVNQGVCSMADMPYGDYDRTIKPNDYQRMKAAQNKALSWGIIHHGDVDEFKRHLAAKDAIVVGVAVYDDFINISPSNPVYDVKEGTSHFGHAICIVGYDDSLNAFKFINSWGTDWGLGGYGYISYDLISHQAAGYIMTDAVNPVEGEWNMEGAVNNKVTDNYGNDGDIIGSATFGNGVIGQAFKLTGSNYINIPNPSKYNNMSNFTLAAWVYPTSQTGTQYIISKTTPNRDFAFDIINGTLNFQIAHGSSYFHVNGGAVPLNTWTHVAAVYTNGTVTLYKNGTAAGTGSLGSFAPPDWTGSRMNIGGLSNTAAFQGKIDEVKVFSNAMSVSEIVSMYQSPQPMDIWSFEGDTSSKGGYKNTAQFVNGASYYPYGITGKAAMFNGSNYINISPNSMYYYMSYFTISAWVYPVSTSGGTKCIISKSSPNIDFALNIDSGNLDFQIAHGSNNFHVYGNAVPSHTWTHVAAVYANGTITLYQNGVQTASSSLGTFAPPDWSGTKMQIGAMNDAVSYVGPIDEVKIFRGGLSPSQIKAEYINGTTGHTP